jgi:hypothetical protein
VLCCLIGGGLLALVARSARRRAGRPHNPLVAVLFGLGAGMLVEALIVSLLAPMGVVHVTGPLAARLALLAGPAVVAGLGVSAGGAGGLLSRSGATAVTVGTVAGALAAEEADLHAFRLHSAPGIVAGLAVHLPAFLFLAAGLAWRVRLPDEGETDAAESDAAESDAAKSDGGRPTRCSEHRVRRVR